MNKILLGRICHSHSGNRKWVGIFATAVVFAMCGAVAHAQQGRIPKIGWLGGRTPGPGSGSELFRRALSDIGYLEGKNIAIEYRYANDKFERLASLADELVRLKVDVIIAPTIAEVLAAKNATNVIPIVFYNVPDPVTAGLVESLARPGGHITGFTIIQTVLAGKRLELLKETVPKISRVALLWNPQDAASAQQWKESQVPARDLGLQLHSIEVSSGDKYEDAFKELTKKRSGALAVTQNALALSHQKLIADLAAKSKLPAIYPRADFVVSGGLMGYGGDREEPYRRAAAFVDKILKGAKPAELPVEQPTKFEFVINLKAAKQIGLTIPPNVLARADRVIR
jgi:putative tryptophan/tyrosine transport system substrate-binding protein